MAKTVIRKRPQHAPSLVAHQAADSARPSTSGIRQRGAAVLWAVLLWVVLFLVFAWEPLWVAVVIGSAGAFGLLVALTIEGRPARTSAHRTRPGETRPETAAPPKAA